MLTQEPVQSRKELQIRTERVDDIVLLIGMMRRMGLPQVLDKYMPAHWKQRELSWGWTAMIWLAYILSEGDHRKVVVEEYVKNLQQTLSEVTGQRVGPLDFTDDRLGIVLTHLSEKSSWEDIEAELSEQTIRVYALARDVVRCDATTASGYHEVSAGGLFQFGHSKDDPRLPQIKIMSGALDPLGMPLVTDVVSGEQADDGLYVPVIDRLQGVLQKQGVLYVGDCKLSAFETRLHIKSLKSHYLCPLPQTGKTPEEMEAWVREGIALAKNAQLQEVMGKNANEDVIVMAAGYEVERQQSGVVNGEEIAWTERVLIVKSSSHARQQENGLEKRLHRAEQKLHALTPPRGRGKRQITEEAALKAAIEEIVKKHGVEGLLIVTYEQQVERTTHYVGRGRGGAHRQQHVRETIRYHLTSVARDEQKIQEEKARCGWRAYVTDAPQARLCLEDAVNVYRQEYRIERIFLRLKNRLQLVPLFVKEPDQVRGLTHLLMLGIRVLTLIEFVVRRSLQQEQTTLAGLHPEHRQQTTDSPTSERLLKAFEGITLTIIRVKDQIIRHLTPLSDLQKEILKRLELNDALYQHLEIHKTSILLSEY
jgi:transposase